MAPPLYPNSDPQSQYLYGPTSALVTWDSGDIKNKSKPSIEAKQWDCKEREEEEEGKSDVVLKHALTPVPYV